MLPRPHDSPRRTGAQSLRADVSANMAGQRSSTRVIRRYGNRKLYDVQTSQYITLDGIRDLIRRGEDVRVVDNDTAEDLTAVTFAQIIFEDAKRQSGAQSLPVFRWLIQRGDEAVRELVRGVERG